MVQVRNVKEGNNLQVKVIKCVTTARRAKGQRLFRRISRCRKEKLESQLRPPSLAHRIWKPRRSRSRNMMVTVIQCPWLKRRSRRITWQASILPCQVQCWYWMLIQYYRGHILQLGRITFRVPTTDWHHLVNLNVLQWCAGDRLVHVTFPEVLHWEHLDETDEFQKPSQGA